MSVGPSVRSSVGPSVGPSVPYYFRTTNMTIFEGEKSSNDITINDTMSDDKVVASYVPPRYLFFYSAVQVSSGGSPREAKKKAKQKRLRDPQYSFLSC